MNKSRLELLSPAKSAEFGIAAVNHGADAVYIGAPRFSARAAACNSLSEIEKLITYAHKYYAKVYIALNTLLYDNELAEVQKLIDELYTAGADALIIQDMGILEMNLPPIPLIASTQTNNVSIEKIRFLEKAGFSRVILARELSIGTIAEIARNTTVELEFFVHGALCVCYSGQCYLSEFTTGRSANRGECSQPCRLLYTLEDAGGKIISPSSYLLSLKDLNLSGNIQALADAGITSFKIEGRLKDISYVKNITAHYRKILDEIISRQPEKYGYSSSGKTEVSFWPEPSKSFNRGFTTYFLENGKRKISSGNTPKSIGEHIGKATKISGNSFVLSAESAIVPGDGLCFFDGKNELTGFVVNKVESGRIFSDDLKGLSELTRVFRNFDHEFQKKLSTNLTKRSVPITIEFCCSGGTIKINVTDEEGNSAELTKAHNFGSAKNNGKLKETIENQLKKTGGTIFSVMSVSVKFDEFPFLPVSFINELRREMLTLLEAERARNYPRKICQFHLTDHPYPEKTASYLTNITNKYAEHFYRRHGVEEIHAGFELTPHQKGEALMHTKYCIKNELGICPFENTNTRGFVELLYINNGKRKFKLEFNCSHCEMKIKSI